MIFQEHIGVPRDIARNHPSEVSALMHWDCFVYGLDQNYNFPSFGACHIVAAKDEILELAECQSFEIFHVEAASNAVECDKLGCRLGRKAFASTVHEADDLFDSVEVLSRKMKSSLLCFLIQISMTRFMQSVIQSHFERSVADISEVCVLADHEAVDFELNVPAGYNEVTEIACL